MLPKAGGQPGVKENSYIKIALGDPRSTRDHWRTSGDRENTKRLGERYQPAVRGFISVFLVCASEGSVVA